MSTIVFDVNETLSDIRPLGDRFAELGLDPRLAVTWYVSTLRDGTALAVHGTSRPYADVARAVLVGMLASENGLDRDPEAVADIMLDAFTNLVVHPDVEPGVRALRAAGHRLITLSNGAASVADGLLGRAGLASDFDALLSVADAPAWKPHPGSYGYAVQHCGLPPADLVMVAVHPWDIDGAARVGLRTAFLNRTGAPYPATFTAPDHTVTHLADLASALAE